MRMISIILRSPWRTPILVIFEGGLAYLCGIAALYTRFSSEARDVFYYQRGWGKILLLVLVVQSCFYLLDLYDFRSLGNLTRFHLGIMQATGLSLMVLAFIFYTLPQMRLGHGVFLISLLFLLTMMTLLRLGALWLLGHPGMAERIIILGTGQNAVNLARELLKHRSQGYEVVGFVGEDPSLIGKSLINPCVIGVTADLENLLNSHRADSLVVALEDERGQLPLDLLLRLKLSSHISIAESPTFYERLTHKISTRGLRPSWLIFSNSSRPMRIYRRARRIADVVLALTGLVVTLPLMVVTALAIKLESRGPIFYQQERVGLRNAVFRIIKFRSMRAEAEADGPVWAAEADPRVTRVGRVIRKLRIDELPQFINILRGEMSFIGPRPERPVFVKWLEQEIEYYPQRHLVKPGLTGWAQICYPYGASLEDALQKLQYDLYYIKNQSPVLDAMIMLETAKTVLFGRGR